MKDTCSIPDELCKEVDAFDAQVSQLRRFVDAYCMLGEHGTSRSDRMDRYAKDFFVELQVILAEQIIVRLMRLVKSSNKTWNDLEVASLVERAKQHVDKELILLLVKDVDSFERHAKQFKPRRDKGIAHLCRERAVANTLHNIPAGKNNDVYEALDALERIRKVLTESVHGPTMFRGPGPKALGLGQVLAAIERCDEWTRLRLMHLSDEDICRAVKSGIIPESPKPGKTDQNGTNQVEP